MFYRLHFWSFFDRVGVVVYIMTIRRIITIGVTLFFSLVVSCIGIALGVWLLYKDYAPFHDSPCMVNNCTTNRVRLCGRECSRYSCVDIVCFDLTTILYIVDPAVTIYNRTFTIPMYTANVSVLTNPPDCRQVIPTDDRGESICFYDDRNINDTVSFRQLSLPERGQVIIAMSCIVAFFALIGIVVYILALTCRTND